MYLAKRGAAPGDVRQVRKEERMDKEAKGICGALGLLNCNHKTISWDVQAPPEELLGLGLLGGV